MLYSIVQFITQAASSSAFIFCFCNLIIVIILMDLKPSLSFHQESEIPVSVVRSTGTTHKAAPDSKCPVQKEEAREVSQEQHEDEAAADSFGSTEEEVEEEVEKVVVVEEEEEEEEDDELRRRVEEFIEKAKEGWKAELLKTSSLV